MEYLTHLAAIAAGVAIALLFLRGGGKTGEKEVAAAAAVPSASGAAKKKKRKNRKKKAAEPAAAAKEPDAPKPAPELVEETPEEDSEEEDSSEEEVAVPAPAPPANGGKKKKKKNKKKKSGAAATDKAAAEKSAPAPETAPPPPAKPPAPAPEIVPLQPRAVAEEEEWATVPKKSKKKRNAVRAPRAAPAAEASAASVTVAIDASRIGIVIGPKGATMIAIQERTGTKLDVRAPKADEDGGGDRFRPVGSGRATPKATVVITEGTAEGKAVAKKAILELADRGYAALLQAEGFGESSVVIHPRFLSEIVGPGGKIIKAIQAGLDVKLTIPKTDWTPKTVQIGNVEPVVRVGIAGDSPANVKKAKQVIRDLCAYHHHPITHPGMIHQEVYVPQEFFHCVIGTRGSEIKHIRGNYKVDVYMPSHESWCVTENVVCVGRAKDVEKAISYIKLLMDRDAELREQKYSDEAYGD